MADSTYVALRNESGLSWYEMVLCEDTQSPQQTPPVPDPQLNPNGQFQGNGRGRGGGLRGGRGRGNGRKNFIFPNKGKGNSKNSKNGGSNGTAQKSPAKCTICEGKHRNMIWYKELTKYLPYGNDQKTLPSSLCLICLGTEFQSGKQCNHKNNRMYQKTVCSAINRHFLLCTECPEHVLALQYLRENHIPALGWKNCTLIKSAFGEDAYKAIGAKVSVLACNSLPEVPVSVSLSKSTLPKVDKGVQVVLSNSGHKEAIGKEAEESHQVGRLTLDKRFIITLEVICVILIGLMWYHVEFKAYQFPGWFADGNKA